MQGWTGEEGELDEEGELGEEGELDECPPLPQELPGPPRPPHQGGSMPAMDRRTGELYIRL